MEKYERCLLMELEGLQTQMMLYIAFEDMAQKYLKRYEKYMDPKLVKVMNNHLEVLHIIIANEFEVTDGVKGNRRVHLVKGLIKDYEDVLQEVETLQAGKPTYKKGGRGVDRQKPGTGGSPSP